MPFSPKQLECLQIILNLSPEKRELALQAAMESNVKGSPYARRSICEYDIQVPPTDAHSDSGISSVSSDLSSSSGNKRIHVKNRVTRLASKLCKQFFASERIWNYLYGTNNRVIDHKLDEVIDKIKKTDKLSVKEKQTLKTHRDDMRKAIKKRMSAGRRYRQGLQTQGKRMMEAHFASTIDLTADGDDDDDTPPENGDDFDYDTPAKEVKKEVEKDVEKEVEKEVQNDSSAAKESTRRQLAMDFRKRIQEKRSRKKIIARKARTPTPRKRKTQGPPIETPRSKKTTTNSRAKTVTDSHAKTTRAKTTRAKETVLQVGDKVQGMWQGEENFGEWYEGIVKSVDEKNKTVHIVYNDGDEDTNVSWCHVSIL